VDLFLFPNAYMDVATIAEVPRLTGGKVYKYSYFQVNHADEFVVSEGNKFVNNRWIKREYYTLISVGAGADLGFLVSAGYKPGGGPPLLFFHSYLPGHRA